MSDTRQVGSAQNGLRLNRTDDGDGRSWFEPMLAMPTRGARGLGLVLARHNPAEEGNEASGLVEPSEPKPIAGTNAQDTTAAPTTIGQPTTAHAALASTNSDPDGREAMETCTDAH